MNTAFYTAHTLGMYKASLINGASLQFYKTPNIKYKRSHSSVKDHIYCPSLNARGNKMIILYII